MGQSPYRMAVLSPDTAIAPADVTRRRRWKRLGLATLAIPVIAGITLFWPGWPLHPLAALVSYRARAQGVELHLRSPWLRLHTDLTAHMNVAEIRLGDPANPDALALKKLNVQWRLGDLVHARLAPETIRLDEAGGTLRVDEHGSLQFIAFPATTPSPSAPAFTPADLPANMLPAEGRSLSVTIARTHLRLPPGQAVAEVATGPVTLSLSQPKTGSLDLAGSLDLRAKNRSGSVQFEGRLDLVRDWLGRFQLNANAAPDAASPAARVTVAASRLATGQPATVSLKVNDCAPGGWLALLGRPDLPVIDGRVEVEIEARGDPFQRHLDSASALIKTTALTVTQPALLTRPLTVTPLRIAFRAEDNGARGQLEPFATEAGPLALSCTGITWQTQGTAISGSGQLKLAAVPLVRLIEWLPPDLRSRITLTTEEAAEIGLVDTTVTLAVAGDRSTGLPPLHVSTRSGVTFNQELLAIEAEADLEAATKLADVKIVVPDFVQARWQLALLRRFPVPELAAPLRAEFHLRGRWPDTLEEARWRIVAGQGHVVPKGPSLRWLAHPFPITSFTLTGRLLDGKKRLTIEQLDFVSGRAHLALERTELNSSQALTSTAGASSARVALKLERWYASDFLPLLGPELQSVVAPAAEDLAQIGLERLETAAELGFSNLPWIDPALNTLTGTQAALVRIGEEIIPVDAVWKFDPASRRVSVSLQLKNLRPDRLSLAALKNSTIPAAALDLAFAVNLEVSADPYAQSLDLMKLKAGVRVEAEGGRIKTNPLLAADLPIKHLLMDASAQILPLRLEKLKVSADFAGPTLLIEDARIDFGDAGRSGMQLTLRELPLDWAYARVPAAWKPAALNNAQVRGHLDKLDLRAEFLTPTATGTSPPPSALTLSADLRDLGLRLAQCPEFAVPRLAISGDLDRLDVLLDRASTDGIAFTDLKLAVSTPLAPQRAATASGTMNVDLARLPALLPAARQWISLPADLDLTGLAGNATLGFTASTPLDPVKLTTDLRAKLDFTARQVVAPPSLLPATVRVGPSALAFTAEVSGQNATGKASWRPANLVIAPWLKGTPTLDATYSLTSQALELHPQLDLANTVIDVPELCWHKSVGLPARLLADLRYTLRTPTAPARASAILNAEGLVAIPFRTRVEADLSDDQRPALNLMAGIARVQVRDTVIGNSSLELDAHRLTDGTTQINLRSPLIDFSEWITQLAPAITAWNQASPTTPAKPAPPAATAPPPATAIPVLALPALNVQADIARVALSPSQSLTGIAVTATLRDGLPNTVKFAASAGEKTTLKLHLESASGRQPWSFQLTDIGGWLRAGAAPLVLIPASPALPDSPLETLRTLPPAFSGGDVTIKGTANWRDSVSTLDGSARIDRLVLEQEVVFLRKIAALVKKRVILQVPFKVFDVPAFTASPTKLALRNVRIEGPLTVTSDHLDLDFTKNEIDMGGKVLGIGFEVAGSMDDPRFYLTEKNLLVKGLTTQEDFDW